MGEWDAVLSLSVSANVGDFHCLLQVCTKPRCHLKNVWRSNDFLVALLMAPSPILWVENRSPGSAITRTEYEPEQTTCNLLLAHFAVWKLLNLGVAVRNRASAGLLCCQNCSFYFSPGGHLKSDNNRNYSHGVRQQESTQPFSWNFKVGSPRSVTCY